MKKKILLLILTVVSIIFLINQFNSKKDINRIRDIYVENKNQIYSYLEQKYDVFNDNKIINIEERFSLEDGVINKLSSNEEYMDVNLLLNKNDNNMKFEYSVFLSNTFISDKLTISLEIIDNEFYVVSRYGYTKLSEFDEYRNISKCASIVTGIDKIYGNQLYALDSGTSAGGALVSGILGTILVYGVNNTIKKIFSSETKEYTNISKNTTNTIISSSESKDKKIQEIRLTLFTKDFLENEDNDYGWTSDELKDKFKKSVKIIVSGIGMVELTDYESNNKRTICLGIYKDIIYDSLNKNVSYTKSALNEIESVIFSASFDWGKVEKEHTREGMWLLNKFFLEYWINKDCEFLLLTNPNPFFMQGWEKPKTQIVNNMYIINPNDSLGHQEEIGYFYGKELQYIYRNDYFWDSTFLSMDFITSCKIKAIRQTVFV